MDLIANSIALWIRIQKSEYGSGSRYKILIIEFLKNSKEHTGVIIIVLAYFGTLLAFANQGSVLSNQLGFLKIQPL